jgi:ribosomal protein S19
VVHRHVNLGIKVVAFRVPVLRTLVNCISITPSILGWIFYIFGGNKYKEGRYKGVAK